MTFDRNILYSVLVLFCFYGCATQRVVLDRAIIKNYTNDIISEVRVQHEPTKNFGEVYSILPRSSFELGFANSPMLADKATVTWKNQMGRVNEAEVKLPRRSPYDTREKPLVLVYSVYPDGSVTAELEE